MDDEKTLEISRAIKKLLLSMDVQYRGGGYGGNPLGFTHIYTYKGTRYDLEFKADK